MWENLRITNEMDKALSLLPMEKNTSANSRMTIDMDKALHICRWRSIRRHIRMASGMDECLHIANGRRDDGYYMNSKYIPDICEAMGLVKGTESFGNCVVRLIEDIKKITNTITCCNHATIASNSFTDCKSTCSRTEINT